MTVRKILLLLITITIITELISGPVTSIFVSNVVEHHSDDKFETDDELPISVSGLLISSSSMTGNATNISSEPDLTASLPSNTYSVEEGVTPSLDYSLISTMIQSFYNVEAKQLPVSISLSSTLLESLISLSRRQVSRPYYPVTASLRESIYTLNNNILGRIFNSYMSFEIKPRKYVDGSYLGANIRYTIVFIASDPDGLNDLLWINLTMRDNTSRVLELSYHMGGIRIRSNFSSVGYHVRKIANKTLRVEITITFPWDKSLELNISTRIFEIPGRITSKHWRFIVVNKTMISSTSLRHHQFKRGEQVEFKAFVTYHGTSIPAPNETVYVNYTRIHGLSGYTTNDDGELLVVFQAPSTPGTYIITLDPEHGEPYNLEIKVLEEYSGYPVIRFEPLLIIVSILVVIIILYFTRYFKR